MAPTVLAIFGPTGIGKTALAVALADRLRARGEHPVAVSADALQVYRGLEILTGAADAADRARLEHRLLAFLPVEETFSAGAYARLAHAEIDALRAEGRTPIVVGGTGLYLQAALTELDLLPPVDSAVRARWTALADDRGPEHLHALLAERHPDAAARTAPGDRNRLIRSHELLDAGHEPPIVRQDDAGLWTARPRVPTRLVGLTMDRAALVARIEARVDAMVAAGAAEEVRRADLAGASATARKALGFDALLAGDVEAMKVATRRYAKRQLTWLRRLEGVELVDVTGRSADEVAAELLP